jgi:hypothetical protein
MRFTHFMMKISAMSQCSPRAVAALPTKNLKAEGRASQGADFLFASFLGGEAGNAINLDRRDAKQHALPCATLSVPTQG